MRKVIIAGFAMAAAFTFALGTAAAQKDDVPILTPKSKSTPRPSTSATLLVLCDLACDWKLDGEAKGRIEAGGSAKAKVEYGQHLVDAATEGGMDKVQKEVEIKTPMQIIVRLELKPVYDARLQAEQDARDQAAKEQAAKEQAAQEQAAREQAARDQAAREQAARDQAAQEQAARDQAARDQAAQEQAAQELAARQVTAPPAPPVVPDSYFNFDNRKGVHNAALLILSDAQLAYTMRDYIGTLHVSRDGVDFKNEKGTKSNFQAKCSEFTASVNKKDLKIVHGGKTESLRAASPEDAAAALQAINSACGR